MITLRVKSITITANHSNYLVDRANTQFVTVRKGNCNSITAMPSQLRNLHTSCSEGRTRDVIFHHFTDEYALFSDVSLRQASRPIQKFPTLFCSRAMLICSIIWLGKRMLRVVVLRVLFFADMRLPCIQCR